MAGFIIFAGLVGMLGTHRLSNRAEESSMEFMHEDMDSAARGVQVSLPCSKSKTSCSKTIN